MKKSLLFISLIISMFAFISCGNNEEMEKLRSENDSLKNLSNENQSQVDQFMSAFNEIQKNLNTIKQKEHVIDLNSADTSEMTPNMKEQVNKDILTIYQLMQENEQALKTLKSRLKSSGIKNQQLKQTLALYEQQMKQKDVEIETLKTKLEGMNFNIQDLNKKIADMAANMDTLEDIQNQQSQVINNQDKTINTVYYVIGTRSELIEHGILSKEGILSKLSVDPNFDKSYFTSIDKRDINSIPINSGKIVLKTKHPSGSFSLDQNDGKIQSLKITDQDKFWSYTKFCVVLIK